MKVSRNKILVPVICALFLLFLSLSIATSMVHADHDCLEDSCSICAVVHRAQSLLKLSGGLVFCGFAALLLFSASFLINKTREPAAWFNTPVSAHVRMNH